MHWPTVVFNLALLLALNRRLVLCYAVITWEWADTSGDNENGDDDVIDLTGSSTPRKDGTGSSGKLEWIDASQPYLVKNQQPRKIVPCDVDKDCGPKKFCHRFYKYCESSRYRGELCRRNENCLPGLVCMWGSCQKENKVGTAGSRCKRDTDCKAGLCCARAHGESVCQSFLKIGEDCEVPDGGMAFSMDHKCPCGPSLFCKKTGRKTVAGFHGNMVCTQRA